MKAGKIISAAMMVALIFSAAGCGYIKTNFALENGNAFLRIGDYKRAISEYNKAKEIDSVGYFSDLNNPHVS